VGGSVKHRTVEEGPLAGWLYRNLKDHVDTMVVCDPRRNHLITGGGDKDDRIDAAKLAALLRGGYVHEVYHSADEQRVSLKHWVALYHDRVKDATRPAGAKALDNGTYSGYPAGVDTAHIVLRSNITRGG